MKTKNVILMIAVLLLSGTPALAAGDFAWMDDFNITAEVDPSGFHARLATRFKIGDVQVNAVLSNCEQPADAYMVLRCGELSGRPVEQVLKEFRSGKGKGWGVMAQRLGIKPGSAEFKALKANDDLFSDREKQKAKGKAKGSAVEKEPGKGRGKSPR